MEKIFEYIILGIVVIGVLGVPLVLIFGAFFMAFTDGIAAFRGEPQPFKMDGKKAELARGLKALDNKDYNRAANEFDDYLKR